ncbi:MAG: M48 metallopeptidase family protein, partial [Tepidimonas sp.]|uniref:M48 metallopeptidase family protein n=1 Tax=Tepidimonas sp. TaxID=2002775 RepID=UPI00405526C3
RAQARLRFAARIAHYAPLLAVRVAALRVSSARTRWGSASTRGTISLNWRLVCLPGELLDYVVVHELAHLREMHHGPAFWALVGSVLPDYADRRAALRRYALD